MQTFWPPEYGVWYELLLVLAVGATAIVGVVAVAVACLREAVWQRTLWQAAVTGLLVLVAVEITGTGRGLVRWCRPCSVDRPATDSSSKLAADSIGRRALPGDNLTWMSAGDAGPLWPASPAIKCAPAGAGGFAGGEPWPAVGPARNGLSPTIDADSSAKIPTALDRVPDSALWPGTIWAVGTVSLLARLCWAGAVLAVLRRRRTVVGDESLRRRVEAFARQMGLRRRVRVLAADRLRAPVAFGILRPSIALPHAFTKHFDSQQQAAILAHELAHLAAGDPAAQWLANLACAVLWWHPAAWWSRRQLRAASEAAADEASLLVPGGPDLLADCLVKLGRRLKHPAELGWLSIEGGRFRSALGRRVERLWNLRTRSWQAPGRGRLWAAKAALSVALVFVAVSCTAWEQSQTPIVPLEEGGKTMSIFSSSWRCSLAATALWALTGATPGDAVAQPSPENKPAAEKQHDVKVTQLPGGGIQVTISEAGVSNNTKPMDAPTRKTAQEAKPKNADTRKNFDDWVKEAPMGEAGTKPVAALQDEAAQKAALRATIRRQRDLAEQAWQLCQKIDGLGEGQKDQAQALREQLERVEGELRQTLAGAAGSSLLSHSLVTGGNGDAVWVELVPANTIKCLIDNAGSKDGNAAGAAGLPGSGGAGAKAVIALDYGPAPDRETLRARTSKLELRIAELSKQGKGDEMQRMQKELDQLRATLERIPNAPQPDQPKPYAVPDGGFEPLPNQPNPYLYEYPRYAPQPGQALNRASSSGKYTIAKVRPDAAVESLQKQVQEMQRQMDDMSKMLKMMSLEKKMNEQKKMYEEKKKIMMNEDKKMSQEKK